MKKSEVCYSSWAIRSILPQILYSSELQLHRANSSDTEVPFLDLNLCISNGTVSTKIYDKRDDFDIVNSPFLDGDVPGVPHMGYRYLNLLDSLELLQILVTLTAVIKPLLPNTFGRAIVILNFVRRLTFRSNSENLLTVIKELAIAWKFRGWLHA